MSSIYFPKNIFSEILVSNLDFDLKNQIKFLPSSTLSQKLKEDENSAALIPTTDIFINKHLQISNTFGLSFEGPLSNSYIYFDSNEDRLDKLIIKGDVSTVEIILSKLIFKELYNTAVDISISTSDDTENKNHLIVGDENFEKDKFKAGISFADQIVELISAPFVNYVFASNKEFVLQELSNKLSSAAREIKADKLELKLPPQSTKFVSENFYKEFFNLTVQDIEGINQIINLPFYHGIINDIVEIKFV